VHRTIRWALNRPTTSERVEEGVLRVEADWQGLRLPGGEVSYRVEVPAGVDVRAWTGAGAVAAAGLRGDVDIRTQAGRIELVDLGGHVRAATQAGQVQGTGLAARQVEAQSNAGAVSLAFEAPPDRVEARTNAGSVDLVVPDQRYAVEAGSAAGRTVVELVGDPTAPRRLVARSNAGRVRVRRADRRCSEAAGPGAQHGGGPADAGERGQQQDHGADGDAGGDGQLLARALVHVSLLSSMRRAGPGSPGNDSRMPDPAGAPIGKASRTVYVAE
jgi:hypothetical protein